MILGRPHIGATALNLAADRVRVTGAHAGAPVQLSHVAAYLDGLGPNAGHALIRAVIYDATDHLIARSDEIEVDNGAAAAWVQFPFTDDGGMPLAGGDYSAGLHVGGVTNCARTWVDDPGAGGSRLATDTYADGSAAVLPSPATLTASLPLIVSVFEPWVAPAIEDLELSRLPWDLAQRVLGATGALRNSRVSATAGWHSTSLDAETGAVAIVRTGGPLEDLVGERVRVTRRVGTLARSVAVFVVDEQDFPDELQDEDLSLSKTAFLRLAPWNTEALGVVVEVLA